MRILNYLTYVFLSILVPQPYVFYGIGKGLWTETNARLVVFIAGLVSGLIFLVLALIDIHLYDIQQERERKRKRER